jgi:hypothetical protein
MYVYAASLCEAQSAYRSAPKARLNASLRQRRRNKYVAKPSAEGAIQQWIMNRAFSASMRTTIPLLGRCPGWR